jgi:threonylcarbamoyladenosine tRNA methylthiotransferase MtaB
MSNVVHTFGCRVNIYESEVIRDNLTKAGVNDAIVFNTCAVTSEAERQARQAIRKARRENPSSRIIVTGCGAQINPAKYLEMPEVDNVLGNQEKLEAVNFLNLDSERARVNDIMELKETALHMTESFDGKTRAFVQVQNGCNHRCTFCIIPFGRGNNRSVPVGDIVNQVKALVHKGYKEVVITGVDITDYGLDLPGKPTLGEMVQRLLKMVPELPRIRLSSIDPVEVDDTVMELLGSEPRFMPHMHISLQAGDDMVLKRMKRRHNRQDVYDFVQRARNLRPDVVFGADIIAGFPTETDEMFENTRLLAEELDITYLHVFPYSQRTGTPAAKMPQVPKQLRKERAAILRAQGERNLQRFLQSQIGQTQKILVESDGKGRTEHFAEVKIAGNVGDIVEAKILAEMLKLDYPTEIAQAL